MLNVDPAAMLLWVDDALLVVNKPAGLPTLPDGYNPKAPYLKSVLAEFEPLWMVHRLDRDTSGVIVLARTAEAHRHLNTQFEQRNVTKTYHALVNGLPTWDEKTVKLPLRPDGDRKHRTVIDPRKGKPAHTDFRVLERFKGLALVEAVPHTGRTHQIRAHLAAQGHPIVADVLYGGGPGLLLSQLKPGYQGGRSDKHQLPARQLQERPILNRLALHAWSLELQHPSSGEPRRFEAAYPQDMTAVFRHLRK